MYRQQTSRAQPDAQSALPSAQAQGRQHVPPSPLSAVLKGPQGSIELSSSTVSVGRSPANQLKVNDPDVSWFHAQICPQEQSHTVVDLESRNGTFVNGQKLPPNTPHRLKINDIVRFGNTTFSYVTDASAHPPMKEGVPVSMPAVAGFQQQQVPSGQVQGKEHIAPPPPQAEARTQRAAGPGQFAPPVGGQRFASLEIKFNIRGGKTTYDLTRPVINIGRDPSNDIVIDASVVSSFHAQIVREGNQLILVHPHPSRSQTTNGLLYQGRHILGNEPFRKTLVRGDVFHIGDGHATLVTLAYNDASGAPQEIVPESPPIPSGAPVSTIDSQSGHPKAQPKNHQPRHVRPRQKFRRPTSKEVTVALISTVGVIIAAIITAVMGPILSEHSTGGASTATPTVITTPSIPRLHPSYTGSFSATHVASGYNSLPAGPITFFSIEENDQGQVQSAMELDSAKYTCQGSVDTSRNLQLTCTNVTYTDIHVGVKGLVSQDSGHLSGTLNGSSSNDLSFYLDARWTAQG